MMGAISDDAIRERAYHIWEREGRPHGRDFEHWVRAQVELMAESSNNSGRKAAAAGASAAAKATRPRADTKGAAKPSRRARPAPAAPRSQPSLCPVPEVGYYLAALDVPGGVAPPRNIPDIPASACLARNVDCSPR
jgi:hypothetical protein